MHSLPSIKNIIQKYNIRASKKLGQNFLFDQNITDQIVELAGSLQGKTVMEIGAGPGLLTRSILMADASKVIIVEKDEKSIYAISDYLLPVAQDRLEIIHDDALNNQLYKEIDEKIFIIANLPYNVATTLLFKWLNDIQHFQKMVLMFQKEVAMRIAAPISSKNYGRLAIKAQLLCDVEYGFEIEADKFFPPPKVTSAVIAMTPRTKPLAEHHLDSLNKICDCVFNQRRKQIGTSLKNITKNSSAILEQANIERTKRPQDISIEEFCKLSLLYQESN